MTKRALIIFYRYPELGKVKTRLARTLGDERALNFYQACSHYIIENLSNIEEFETFVFLSDEKDLNKYKKINCEKVLSQSSGDLGAKMENAFIELRDKGYEEILLIATDTPDINIESISSAFQELIHNQYVFIPAIDGGYCLVGSRCDASYIFKDMQWSTPSVLSDTLKKINSKGDTYSLLEPMQDIDTEDDLKLWLKSAQDHPLKDSIASLVTGNQTKS